jgi:hypothetical protein
MAELPRGLMGHRVPPARRVMRSGRGIYRPTDASRLAEAGFRSAVVNGTNVREDRQPGRLLELVSMDSLVATPLPVMLSPRYRGTAGLA